MLGIVDAAALEVVDGRGVHAVGRGGDSDIVDGSGGVLDDANSLPGIIDGLHLGRIRTKQILGGLNGAEADIGILRLLGGILRQGAIGNLLRLLQSIPVTV